MKKRVFGRQLGRTKNQRRALFRNLMSSLIEKGEIVTTSAKAKAIRPELERLITKAKTGTLADRRIIFRFLGRRDLVNRLVDSIGIAFANRPGGYLRLVKLANRTGDQAETVKIMLTETPIAKPIKAEVVTEKTKPVAAQPVIEKTKKGLKAKASKSKKVVTNSK